MERQELLYLSRQDVEAVGVSMAEIIEWVERVFVEKGHGRVEMPPKPGVHPFGDSFIHAMPACVPEIRAAGIKWVSGYPGNPARGLPYISGLIVLNDFDTGLPICVMDASWVTAMRTGAATAVAAKYLARRDAANVAIIGCGVQGRSNAVALRHVLPAMAAIWAYDISAAAMAAYAEEMAAALGLPVHQCASAEEAVRAADVVVTATPIVKNPQPFVRAEWLRSGAFVCTLDFDSAVCPEVFARADKFYSDDVAQQRHYKENLGYFRAIPDPQGDLGEVVVGAKPGREREDEIIVSTHLGLAIEDMATGMLIYQRAVEKAVGTWLPL
ncbi:MAG: ornithine cyclodeaminase family protein [Armatimonadetes bacterium]|nr:ornithine cyclodeaminase family protein [Armatimonadota bacterium]